MLTQNQVDLIAAIGRRFYVLAFLIVVERPVFATEIARRLRTGRGTIGRYLNELSRLQVIRRTSQGWVATPAGRQLVQPVGRIPAPPPAPGRVFVAANKIPTGSRSYNEVPK